MNAGRLNLGLVGSLTAESFGQPGSRTFRVRATTDSGEVSIWLEKEQLVALGAAITQLLERIPEDQGLAPKPVPDSAQVTGEVAVHAGSLSIGFDTSQDGFALEADELWDATLDVQTLMLLASRTHLTQVESQVDDIASAGRPRCTMCGRPIGPGAHFCPPSNGHAHVAEDAATE